jgi:hypothetical protein
MRNRASNEEIDRLFRQAVAINPAGHRLGEGDFSALPSMSRIGG